MSGEANMLNVPDFFRRLQPRDPRDRGRNVFIAVCLVLAAALIVALMLTGHGG